MENYSDALNDIFQSLADPTRRAVILRLGGGEASIGTLAEPFDMALPSFMKHIRQLEEAGLIVTRKQACPVLLPGEAAVLHARWLAFATARHLGRPHRPARTVCHGTTGQDVQQRGE